MLLEKNTVLNVFQWYRVLALLLEKTTAMIMNVFECDIDSDGCAIGEKHR